MHGRPESVRRRVRGAKRTSVAVAGALAVGLALSGCAPVDPTEGLGGVDAELDGAATESLDALLAEIVALSGASGGIASVSAPWAGRWDGAVGTVGFDEGAAPVTVDTPFRLGAATTEITCLILLRLEEQGVLAMDDPVGEYVDDIPGLEGITLEQLCRHTSGVADYFGPLRTTFLRNPARNWPPGELISSALASARTSAPGAAWSPSRTGVLLAALAAERATHRGWNDLAAEYVLDPLDLDHTSLPAATATAPAGALGAYAAMPGPDGAPDCAARVDVSNQSSSIGGEAAGAMTSLDDAVRLTEAFATGALIGEYAEKQQWTTVPTADGAPSWYAQGIGGMQYGPMRGTAGEMPGTLTAAFTDPDSGLTVVVVLNNSSAGADFVREAAFAFASVGSKLAPSSGETAPHIELPWSIDQAKQNLGALAKCPNAAPPTETTG